MSLPETKFCPECQKAGKKSKVFYEGSSRTGLAGGRFFWDEDGKRHSHDPNTTTHAFRCSNGHNWTEKQKHKCWCEE